MASDPLVVRRHVRFSNGERGRRRLRSTTTKPTPAAPPVPRTSRLMALAIVLDEMVRAGKVASYAELARLAHVSRSQLTQIIALGNLAPDLQEAVLFLAPARPASDRLSERQLRQVVAATDWEAQRRSWQHLIDQAASPPTL